MANLLQLSLDLCLQCFDMINYMLERLSENIVANCSKRQNYESKNELIRVNLLIIWADIAQNCVEYSLKHVANVTCLDKCDNLNYWPSSEDYIDFICLCIVLYPVDWINKC